MAGGRFRDDCYNKDFEQNKELRQDSDPHRADVPYPEETGEGEQAYGEAETPIVFGFKGVITLRKVRIQPEKKRKDYIKRLENIIKICETALSDPDTVQEIQLKAANVIIRAIRMSYLIVKEVDIENLEQHTKEIQAKLEKRDREGQVRAQQSKIK